jgi:hypothetical protein
MAAIVVKLNQTSESVTRPVILEITRSLFEITGIPKDTRIFYPDEDNKRAQPGSTINRDGVPVFFQSAGEVAIEVEENYERDRILAHAIVRPENLFIFRDDALQVAIKPAYSPTDVTINFKYRALDKSSALRWRDDLMNRVAMSQEINLHKVSYSYFLPTACIDLLTEVHRLRENVDPYGDTFEQYFTKMASNKVSKVTNLSGEQFAYAVAETQRRIQGYFDFEGAPERGDKTDENATWTISFSYKFNYDKPIECVLRYPLMVHNQVIGDDYRPTPMPDSNEEHLRSYALSTSAFYEFESGKKPLSAEFGFRIPEYDDMQPSDALPYTRMVFQAMTTVDDAYPTHFLSLKDLGDIEFKPEIIAFMKGEAPFMNKPYQSIFNVGMTCMGVLSAAKNVWVDTDLDVHCSYIRNKRNYYHVILSIVTNLEMLSKDALDRLRNNGGVLISILDAIDPTLRQNGQLPPILRPDYVKRDDLNKAIDIINGNILTRDDRFTVQFNTVETLFVQTLRRSDADRYN